MRKAAITAIIGAILVFILAYRYFSPSQITTLFNNSPTLESFTPSNKNFEIMEGDTVEFEVSAVDPDGDALQYIWFYSNSDQSRSAIGIYSFTFQDAHRGKNTIKCEIQDGKGGTVSIEWLITVHYIELQVETGNIETIWRRDDTTDLPICDIKVAYSISNKGDVTAKDVQIIVDMEREVLRSESTSILSGDEISRTVTVLMLYDTSKDIIVRAQNEYSTDSSQKRLSAYLDRFPKTQNIRQLYVTPQDPVVSIKVNDIFEGKAWWDTRADWKVIYDWVREEIAYEYDENQFGVEEYWQLSRETLERGKGDCEDQAILLCTLLRAKGYSSDDVLIILGYGEKVGHAWATFKVFTILGYDNWMYLEATSSGWLSDVEATLAQVLGLYENEYGGNRVYFNDQLYEVI